MRRTFFYLALLLVSVLIGIQIARDPGYLLISYHKWTVEMPLWSATLAFLILFFLLYWLLRTLQGFLNIPVRWQLKRERRHTKKLQLLTKQSFFALLAADWSYALNKLRKAALHSKTPWLYYLSAAYAADKAQRFDLRDTLLQKASSWPDMKIGVLLSRAQYQYAENPEQAIALLEYIRQLNPKQPHALRLLARCYAKLKEWNNLLLLLPIIQRKKILPPKELLQLEIKTYRDLLQRTETPNLKGLEQLWSQVPRSLRSEPELVACYAELLAAKNLKDEAVNVLAKNIPKNFNENLLRLYVNISSSKPEQQLSQAEKWLNIDPKNAGLLLMLGRLCIRNQLWGKARRYLEASLAMEERIETYQELASLLTQLGEDPDTIITSYKAAAQLVRG